MRADGTRISFSSENPLWLLEDLKIELNGTMEWLRQNELSPKDHFPCLTIDESGASKPKLPKSGLEISTKYSYFVGAEAWNDIPNGKQNIVSTNLSKSK